MTRPLVELGGAGPLLHLAPANSFPLGAYRPLIEPWLDRFRVVAIPPRGLWPNAGPAPEGPGSWEALGEEFAAGLVEHNLRDVVGVGHSFGAVASLVAAARRPDRFSRLVLLDPTLLLPAHAESIYHPDEEGVPRHMLATRARFRRAEFGSEQEAFEYWRPRPLFHDWPDASLWHYVRGGLRPADDGAGLTLVWQPDWEAHYYEGLYRDAWREIGRLDPSLPVLVVRGGTTDTFTPAAAERFREIRPSATLVDLPGFGHLFPMAAPAPTAELITNWIRSSRPTS